MVAFLRILSKRTEKSRGPSAMGIATNPICRDTWGSARQGQEDWNMDKKSYRKPEVKTRKLELGVFGDYSDNGGDNSRPNPISIIDNLKLHMD